MCNWVCKTEVQSTAVSVFEGKTANLHYNTICLYSENTLYMKETEGKSSFFALFQKEIAFSYCFYYRRKSNNDLIARKHAYNMRLGNLSSWKPYPEIFSNTFIFRVFFPKGTKYFYSLYLINPHMIIVRESGRLGLL